MIDPVSGIQKRVGIAGCRHTTLELIDGLLRAGYKPDQIITIGPDAGAQAAVAGYLDLREPMRARGIPVFVAQRYSLKSADDQEAIAQLGLDMLLVMGWQRLIPEWFLNILPLGAFGMHGSSRRLPHGRGRSPLNWSLIQNKSAFFTHLFRFDAGADSGKIAGVQVFEINDWDDCYTLHLKNTLSMIQLILRLLPQMLDGTVALQDQPREGATYYPKRAAEDGEIYWSDGALDIYNLIRAVTRPFPGAFTFFNGEPDKKVTIWRAIPFGRDFFNVESEPGQLLHVFTSGEWLVQTGTSSLLVRECEGYRPQPEETGQSFGNLGHPRKVWENIPL